MKYNWLQALEMVANGQPMHVEEDACYLKNSDGVIRWYDKTDDKYIGNVIIGQAFMYSTFKPYHKQIELTEDEKVILRNVDGKYIWICRNSDGSIYLYVEKPSKGKQCWSTHNDCEITGGMFNHLFQQIKWEDAEPRLIADLIK